MKKNILIAFLFLIGLSSCQKNDICIESMPSTPRVVVEFRDYQRPARIKSVRAFNLKEINSEDYYYSEPISDTLALIPLPTDRDSSSYKLLIHQDDSTATQSATVRLSYTPEEVYVSRACGFRTRFESLKATISENEWIKDLKIPDTTIVDDEETTHLYIYH